jgi:hypothetical protein
MRISLGAILQLERVTEDGGDLWQMLRGMLACRNIVGRRQTTDLSDVWCGRSESALIQLTSGVANAATCSNVMLDGKHWELPDESG